MAKNDKLKSNQNSEDRGFNSYSLILSILLPIIIGILFYFILNIQRLQQEQQQSLKAIVEAINNQNNANNYKDDDDVDDLRKPLAWIYGDNMQYGYLRHVIDIFQKIGFRVWTERNPPPSEQYGDWNVLWAHEYPFSKSYNLPELKSFQKVNHFPGSGFITNKVNLATSGLKHIPRAFMLPNEKEEFLNFSRSNPSKLWVQKDNRHRGIRILSLNKLDLDRKGTFIQEYIQNPLLIDGKKFDIGLYVTMTSLNPLRLYVLDNEALLRFCAKPYFNQNNEFNSSDIDSYVVGDEYTPIWQIPSLAKYYHQSNMKLSLNTYLKHELNVTSAESIWQQMEESIKTIFYVKEEDILKIALKSFKNMRNFFELIRFDFTLDDQLNVYLMEANMSPNLASSKYPLNQMLYEQVIYNSLSLIGLVQMPFETMATTWVAKPKHSWNMYINDKDLSILPEICAASFCSPYLYNDNNTNNTNDNYNLTQICVNEQCDCCLHCLSDDVKQILLDAYMEEMFRYHNRRLIPSTSKESPIESIGFNTYIQDKWFIGKCMLNDRWCN